MKGNVLEPLDLGPARFASVALNGVLHCLPATPQEKAAVFGNLKPLLQEGGVVFGSTILGRGVEHGRLARRALALYNREGIFTNLDDDRECLEHALAAEFSQAQVQVRGSFALFSACRPERAEDRGIEALGNL